MAAYPAKSISLLFLFVVLLHVYSVNSIVKKAPDGCSVCGKKSQKNNVFQDAEAYLVDFASCFNIHIVDNTNSQRICEGCRRAVREHRRTGKIFHHVSGFSKCDIFTQSAIIYCDLIM
jgi:hypothetical protein